MDNLIKQTLKTLGVLMQKKISNSNSIVDWFFETLNNNQIPLLFSDKMLNFDIQLKYKVKKIDENNHSIDGNLQNGEIDKLKVIFDKQKPDFLIGFSLKSINSRKSCGDGLCFFYSLTLDFDYNYIDISNQIILQKIKDLDMSKSDLLKLLVRDKYSTMATQKLRELIKVANTTNLFVE